MNSEIPRYALSPAIAVAGTAVLLGLTGLCVVVVPKYLDIAREGGLDAGVLTRCSQLGAWPMWVIVLLVSLGWSLKELYLSPRLEFLLLNTLVLTISIGLLIACVVSIWSVMGASAP